VRQVTWRDANEVASTCGQAHNQQQFGIGPARPVAMSKTLNRCDVLARIDRDIAEGERHVAEQIALIKWMSAECLDTTLAQSLLFNLEETLKHWHAHRQLILEANPQDQAHDF
jgi:hypothetical protein